VELKDLVAKLKLDKNYYSDKLEEMNQRCFIYATIFPAGSLEKLTKHKEVRIIDVKIT
jgi:hypothetical protein